MSSGGVHSPMFFEDALLKVFGLERFIEIFFGAIFLKNRNT